MIRTFALLAAVLLGGCGGDCLVPGGCDKDKAPGTSATTTTPTLGGAGGQQAVVYTVTGTATNARLTYESSGGATQQATVPIPWNFQRSAVDKDFLYLSAQNEGETGVVTVTITVGGTQFRTATSSGSFGVATVSGTCC